ncbi:MAG: TonB-dependent siderophore receptor [Cyanobacteria bacterium P01_A01_bin.116]
MAKLTKLLSWIGLFSVLLTSAVSADPINIESLRTSSKQRQENSLTEPPVLSPTLSPALSQGLPQITDLQIVPSDTGLTLNLSTTGPIPEPETSTSGNALIFEISGATLAIPEEDLQQFEPADGIVLVQVSQVSEDRVRVAITGTDALPAASTTVSANGLAIAIAPGIAVTNEDDDSLRIVVTGDQDEGYNPSSAGTATGTDTLLRDVPFSVQVIPRAVIEDRNVTELGDVLETAGSVVEAGGRGASVFGPNFLLRGFPVSDGIFRDGISTFSLAPLSSNDIEQVEVLRGPASVLFGQGEPGGIINLVSKRPLSEPFYSVSGTVGSFSTYRSALDLSGPLNEEEDVRYRLNLSYENEGSFRDFVSSERVLVSPIVTLDINENTSLDLYGQYAYDRETIDGGIPFTSEGEPIDVPRSRFLGEEFGEFTQEQLSLGYRVDHEFSEDWSLRHALQYLQYSPRRYVPFADSFDEETGELQRLEYFAGGRYQRFFTNAEAIGRFNTGSIEHQLLFGAEYRNDFESPEFQFDDLYEPINVFNPVYTREPYEIAPTFFRDDNISTVSLYIQDQIEIFPELKLLAGVRYDTVDQFRTTRDIGEDREEFNLTDEAFTPRFGIVYQPVEPISLYASYTTSFNPAFGASRNGDDSVFEPETGRQFEVGTKFDISDQLSLNLAAFDIRRQNVVTDDPDDPLLSIQTGEVASRGIELNLGGEILPGWNMTAAYTYLDAFVSEDNTDIVGNRLENVPDNQFSLFTTYEVQGGNLRGLGAGLGLFYVSDRQGDLTNTFTLPSYFRTDASLFYKRDNWRTQLNIENLFDIEYFTSSNSGSDLEVNPGAPFGVTVSFSIDF